MNLLTKYLNLDFGRKIKKSKKVYGSLKDLNGSISELERALQKETGRRIKLQKINLKDLYK